MPPSRPAAMPCRLARALAPEEATVLPISLQVCEARLAACSMLALASLRRVVPASIAAS